MEPRFAYDFDQVRVHTDARAAESARSIGAQAYTLGRDVVFGAGKYAPGTAGGKWLLAHELAHVVQSTGRTTWRPTIGHDADSSEGEADRAATAIQSNRPFMVSTDKPPAIRLVRDPRLEGSLERIRSIVGPYTPELADRLISEALQVEGYPGIDLTDPDNLQPIVATITNTFPGEMGRAILTQFLSRVEAIVPRRTPSVREPTPAQQAQMERTLRMMQVQPRGPYGKHGIGVVFPVVSEAARPLLPIAEFLGRLLDKLENVFGSAGGLVRGIYDGLSESINDDEVRQLANRLLESQVLTVVFPPLFAAGAAVGIAQDVYQTIRSIFEMLRSAYNAILNPTEAITAALQVVEVFFSRDGVEVAHTVGREIGKEYAPQIIGMLRGNLFEFTYDLGRLVGPPIVYTVLSFLGIPQAAAAAIGARLLALVGRLLPVLRRVLRRFPMLVRAADRIAARLGHKRWTPEEPLRVFGGRRRLSITDMYTSERLGGHTLERHGPQHTRVTLRERITGEREIPPPRTLPGGVESPDFRVWQGKKTEAASRWADEDTMLHTVSDIINDHIAEIEQAARTGTDFPRLERIPVNRRVGEGWATTGGAPAAQRGIFWREDLRRATVVIRGDGRGGWYVLTSYPE